MGSQYTFYDHINADGENKILDWLGGVGGIGKKDRQKLKAKFQIRLQYLEGTHVSDWQRPYFDNLHSPCDGLYEIRAEHKKIQYRIIGFHGPERGTGTLLVGAREISNEFDPRETCRRAQEIKTLVESDTRKYRRVHDFS